MRRLIAALVSSAALGALPLVTAGPAAADPAPDPLGYTALPYDLADTPLDADDIDDISDINGSAAVVSTEPGTTASRRFVGSWRCRLGGGVVVRNWQSPTRLSCIGGTYNSYWVIRFGL
ncbi:MAG: hypothetical protein HOW71_40670 [Nonomuraea sp.]|nr:hypothetical protein [Nonomuraea sp.]NUP68489.1 hypothetical protein [Nonomuraea sp.]NUS05369.1 hypothetical protein [Nonomuraea sp.]